MVVAAMLDSDHQAFFDAKDEFLIKVATLLPYLVKIGLKLREQHQYRPREPNVPVIFTDKVLLQIRA